MKPPIRLFIAAMAAAAVVSGCAGLGTASAPRPAPDITVRLLSGKEVSLASLRGRPTVIGVGATWCPHCMHEAPIFAEAYRRYKGRINMLGIIAKSSREDAETFIKKTGLDFMIALDPDGSIAKRLGVTGFPSSFFIDREGYIVDENFGGVEKDDLFKKIDNLLKEK